MARRFGNDGFSLTEVLIATGILTVGFVLIAGTFPVGIKLTAVATERTIGAVAADEAFAKIQLYGFDPNFVPFNTLIPYSKAVLPIDVYQSLYDNFQMIFPDDPDIHIDALLAAESLYPSTDIGMDRKKYSWSVLCKRVSLDSLQVVVFVSRTIGTNASYPYLKWDVVSSSWRWQTAGYPRPVLVKIDVPQPPFKQLNIVEDDSNPDTNLAPAEYVSAGAILVEAVSGQIMRVLERDGVQVKLAAGMVLTAKFDGWLWVIPPSVPAITDEGGSPNPPAVTGRYPCVGVYQRVLVQ